MLMEQERCLSYSNDADLPNGFKQKNVIIQRDRLGYGLTVSGDNPVYVLSVREGGAAHRAGININDQIIKVNGTRVTHCTHNDVVKLIKAGSYAQLTLLSPVRTNSTAPATNDSTGDRVIFRPQFSTPERTSSISSHSVPSLKKARETFDRIAKQLDASKKDLERQRAKSLTHNPNKVNQLENQIRLYEQQLDEIKRRLESIETPNESSAVKSSLSDENLPQRPHTFIETSTNRGSLEPGDFDDDNNNHSVPSNLQSISSFDDLQQMINSSNWIPITIFLHFLLTDPSGDPSQLLFYILTEELRLRKVENRTELIRWIFEIHSTFTMHSSPLNIGLPQVQTDAINRCLDNQQQEFADDWKSIFNDARDYARSMIGERQLNDFHHRRVSIIQTDLNMKTSHFIEETLRSTFEYHYKSSNTEDWNSMKSSRSLAITCSLATYLKRCDIKKCGNIPLEKIPKFLDREQKGILAKLQRTTPVKKIRDHQLNEHQFTNEIYCQVCLKALWGINYQGYFCAYCQHAYHRECALNSEKCSKDRAKLRKFNANHPSSPSRATSMIETREGSIPNDMYETTAGSGDTVDPTDIFSNSVDQSKLATVGRCSSDRRAGSDRPAAPKNRSSSNPQMGNSSIDELLRQRLDAEINRFQQDSNNTKNHSVEFETNGTDGDSDLEADVNTLPNLAEFIRPDLLQILYQTREWKFQTTINELIHTERTHLKSLKIMKICFKAPMENFPGMSPVEIDCIFRNLDQLIHLHTQFKYALRQHREETPDRIVRQIGDVVLRFLDGEKGEQFARACAYFIEDQSQALKLIKKKEQSADFAMMMRNCEANPLCRRLTLKDYLPSIMTRFTKYKLLFEAMKKFVNDEPIESSKLSRCIECADNILKRMNSARMKKEQEALIKQIKSNLDIQIPNDEKVSNLQDCLEVTNNRLIYSGTLKLLPDVTTQKTDFECCLFTDMFVFFQKIAVQSSEQRGIDESFRYILKEHQRDASSGRHPRPRPMGSATKFIAAQNFFLTPIIRLEHLLIKRKACGGARSFYVIDTDKKQLIEVEANSKDDLEKWLEWIEKARKGFEKSKSFGTPTLSQSRDSSISTPTIDSRSTIIEEQIDLQSNELSTPVSLIDSIIDKDKELKRLIHEKQTLLLRLLQSPSNSLVHSSKANSSLEAITYATSSYNQLIQIINQSSADLSKAVDLQSIWTPVLQLGDQLTLALKLLHHELQRPNDENHHVRRNSSSLTNASSVNNDRSQTYSDLSLGESENSTENFYPSSAVTDLDETIKESIADSGREMTEREDEVVFDEPNQNRTDDDENTSVLIADSDDDEIEHFDTSDGMVKNSETNQNASIDSVLEAQMIKLEFDDEDTDENLKRNDDQLRPSTDA